MTAACGELEGQAGVPDKHSYGLTVSGGFQTDRQRGIKARPKAVNLQIFSIRMIHVGLASLIDKCDKLCSDC